MKGTQWVTTGVFLVAATAGFGLGQEEDPNQVLTKTFSISEVRTLEIRGEIQFTLTTGPQPLVTVETTRALFDQLNVSNLWGNATVAIESGLRGPRERGAVKVTIALPSLVELTVRDHSSGTGVWPGVESVPINSCKVNVYEESSLDLTVVCGTFDTEVSWMSTLVLKGRAERLEATLRHQARMVSPGLKSGSTKVHLDEASSFEGGDTGSGSGSARHGSRITVPDGQDWSGLTVLEESVIDDRSPKIP